MRLKAAYCKWRSWLLCEVQHCGFGNCTVTVNFAAVQKAITSTDINVVAGFATLQIFVVFIRKETY